VGLAVDHLPSNLPVDGHSFRRVEVMTGEPRRRRWSSAAKAAVVAESLEPGAVASAVALRHGLHRNQLYAWRRELRVTGSGHQNEPTHGFVPVVPATEEPVRPSGAGVIEIVVGAVVIRVIGTVEAADLRRVLAVVRGCS
jgi:transposase